MSIIKLPLLYVGLKGDEQRLYTLFDSGANLSCISSDFAEALGGGTMQLPERIATARADHFIEVRERILLNFYIEDVRLSDEFLVVPGLTEEAILGVATLQKWRIKLDFEHDQVHVNPTVARMQI